MTPISTYRHPLAQTTELLLVRHGRTAANRDRIIQGQIDIPLDAFGVLQAERAAAEIAHAFAPSLLVTSPLSRAAATAAIIGKRVGLVPVTHPGLAEMHCGVCEGVAFSEIVASDPALAARLQDPDDLDFGWPGGETRRQFHARVRTTFDDILRRNGSDQIVVVAHGGVIGAFTTIARGVSPGDRDAYDLDNCGITHVALAPDPEFRAFNATAHLAGLVDPFTDDPR